MPAMEEGPVTPEGLAAEHRQLGSDIRRLGNIATELDEFSLPHMVERWASRAVQQPSALMPRLVELLASFERGLEDHLEKEEGHFYTLAQQHDIDKLLDSLIAEHRGNLRDLAEVRRRAEELSRGGPGLAERTADLKALAESLKAVLYRIEVHAAREDELLFITGHNI